jgi:hypothetical protein
VLAGAEDGAGLAARLSDPPDEYDCELPRDSLALREDVDPRLSEFPRDEPPRLVALESPLRDPLCLEFSPPRGPPPG